MPAIFLVTCDGPADFERWKLQGIALDCYAWEIDELWYIDHCKGGTGSLKDVSFHEPSLSGRVKRVESVYAALDEAKEMRPVFVEGPRKPRSEAIELRSFRHPRDAIYVFGGDRSVGLWPAFSKVDAADWIYVRGSRGNYAHKITPLVAQRRYEQRDR